MPAQPTSTPSGAPASQENSRRVESEICVCFNPASAISARTRSAPTAAIATSVAVGRRGMRARRQPRQRRRGKRRQATARELPHGLLHPDATFLDDLLPRGVVVDQFGAQLAGGGADGGEADLVKSLAHRRIVE